MPYQLSNQISKSHSQLDLEFLRQERLVDRNVLVSLELKESGYMLSKDFKDFSKILFRLSAQGAFKANN